MLYSDYLIPVVDLVGESIFWPRSYNIEPSGEISLGIHPLFELLDMYRRHKATGPHDKLFALLAMCSDLPKLTAAGLILDGVLEAAIDPDVNPSVFKRLMLERKGDRFQPTEPLLKSVARSPHRICIIF
ncbi:hypothetical protein B0H67DRAFT_308643 [Lasiosphaeris hirsuta]|uniref:Uncharacterized protein n=1 Tax=Lasiosphaeris hirsuta TaxID=260670 RepID=A0AA40DN61_9PEZI|nr:hypothetical protein B0H67DRAFT_308643 [Lasiosphaeris hirsuta]